MARVVLATVVAGGLLGRAEAWEAAAERAGIPVPGLGTSPLAVFRLMSDSCHPRGSQDYSAPDIIANSLKMLTGETGDKISRRMFENLLGSVGEVDVNGLMGRWIRVFNSASLGQGCERSHWRMLSAGPMAATFSLHSYHSAADSDAHSVSQGYGFQLGSGPGQTLLTPHNQPCPYVVVKVGPRDEKGLYEYVILSQFLKTPVLGYARDPARFELRHRQEVRRFLRSSGYINPLTPPSAALSFVDFATCPWDPYAPFG